MRIAEKLAANSTIERPISGRYLLLKTAGAEIEINGQGLAEVNLAQGESYDLGGFKNGRIKIKNTAAVENIIVLEVTENEQKKAGLDTINVTAVSTAVLPNQNLDLPFVNVTAGMAVKIANANNKRRSLRVSLLSTAANYVLIGGPTVLAGRGGPIEEGTTDFLDTEGELWAFNPGVADVVVYLMEMNKL